MSRPHDGQRPSFPFGNPFRMIFPKESYLSPWLFVLLNSFEETLANRLKNLKPKDKGDVLSLSWMRLAMSSLCETHTDIKTLINELKFPVSDSDQKWMDIYLDNSVKLLDICIAFSSELSRLSQGKLLLQFVKHALENSTSAPTLEQLSKARTSLDEWSQQISSKNTKLESSSAILHGLAGSLYLTKVKNSAKGRVLMRAMYGVKVQTIFICSVFAAAFSGSMKTLMNLHVYEKFLWASAFKDLQVYVNGEIRQQYLNGSVSVLKEMEAVDACVKKLYPLTNEGINPLEAATLKNSVVDLEKCTERFSQGLDHLSKEVDCFFQIVLTGRDALLGSLRAYDSISDPKQEKNIEKQVVR